MTNDLSKEENVDGGGLPIKKILESSLILR